MYCVHCGEELNQNTQFCAKCGHETRYHHGTTEVEKNNNKGQPSRLQVWALVMGIAGFFLAPLCLLAIIFGAITLKEKPNNYAKLGLWLGIIWISTLIFMAVILMALNFAREKANEAQQKSSYHQSTIVSYEKVVKNVL